MATIAVTVSQPVNLALNQEPANQAIVPLTIYEHPDDELRLVRRLVSTEALAAHLHHVRQTPPELRSRLNTSFLAGCPEVREATTYREWCEALARHLRTAGRAAWVDVDAGGRVAVVAQPAAQRARQEVA